ncbi:MAG: hypothetical protein RMK49_19910, partial [Abditibacteriales bacterium]|nr:hypothetical protein [Abditibacteriales bacterium]
MLTEFPLAPESPLGNPAPLWFILLFKVLGFTLHLVPMHLWFAGMVLVALFSLFGGEHARRLAHRLVSVMPILIALGVNFGIVPLLFIQVAYYPVVYPANILIGWFWFAVIPLLLVAYYGAYYYAVQVRQERVDGRGVTAGVVSAIAFLLIGFIFANNFSLMTNREQMLALYDRTNVAGAVTGTALNLNDPTLLPRYLMMFGLALTTTAVFVMVDAAFFGKGESEAYRTWAARRAVWLYAVGVVWFAVMGAWYLFGTLRPDVRAAAQADPRILTLFTLTAVSPGIVWLLLWRAAKWRAGDVFGAAAAQVIVLALNAMSRQWVQNVELAPFFDPAQLTVKTQWSPMIAFLALLVVGV